MRKFIFVSGQGIANNKSDADVLEKDVINIENICSDKTNGFGEASLERDIASILQKNETKIKNTLRFPYRRNFQIYNYGSCHILSKTDVRPHFYTASSSTSELKIDNLENMLDVLNKIDNVSNIEKENETNMQLATDQIKDEVSSPPYSPEDDEVASFMEPLPKKMKFGTCKLFL